MTNRDKCHRKERNQDNYKKQKHVLYCFNLCYMIMLCMSIFLIIFRSFFFSIRLVFSKVLFILMFRVKGKDFKLFLSDMGIRQHRPHGTLISIRHTKEGSNVCIYHQFL